MIGGVKIFRTPFDGATSDDHDQRAVDLPVAPSIFKFAQHGQSGMWMSEILPQMSTIADKFCMIRSLHTEAINHDPPSRFARPDRSWLVGQASGRG